MSVPNNGSTIDDQYIARVLRDDKYSFGRVLGSGEFGTSILLTNNEEKYVCKVIPIPAAIRQKGAEDKFKKIMDDLNMIHLHGKNIKFSVNKEENVILIINNYYQNGSIDKYLRMNCGKYNDELIIISIIYQTLILVNSMHANRRLHFNLKPRNIYFNSDWKLVFDIPGIGFGSNGISILSSHHFSRRYKMHNKLINHDCKLFDLWPLLCIYLELIFGKISFNRVLLNVLDSENINLRFSSQSYYSQELKDFIFLFYDTIFNNEKLKNGDCIINILRHELFGKLNRPNQVLSLVDINNSKDLLSHIKTHYPFILQDDLPKLTKLYLLMTHKRMKAIRNNKSVYSNLYTCFETLLNGGNADIIFEFPAPTSWEFWFHISAIFYLLRDTKFIHLQLRRCSITSETVGILCESISYLTQLRTDFTLGANKLSGSGKIIARTFKHLKALEALYLWTNEFDKESIINIFSELPVLTQLTKFDFSNEKFDEDIIRHLSFQFKHISNLLELYLYGNNLDNSMCLILMEHIRYLPSLKIIDLHENKLTDECMPYFTEHLKYTPQLQTLALPSNRFSDDFNFERGEAQYNIILGEDS